jgi:hypothetical protein
MSTHRDRNPVQWGLPPLLIRVIHAARHARADTDRSGHDAVLTELARWALVSVPSRSVLAPADDHAYKSIQEAAMRHLQYGDARQALRKALSSVESLERRDAIESAQNWVQLVSDDAYYYAGLACGVTLAHISIR